jgi:CxxC motif-containing protein (DUF1111 family)
LIFAAVLQPLSAQVDPGIRPDPSAAGEPIPGLTFQQRSLFNSGKDVFEEIDSVSGTIRGEGGKGLGPGFNMNSCAGCHAFPATGGASPRVNPQIAVATLHGAINAIPPFIKPEGPVREVRFKRNPDGTNDGGVHNLFVITGRSDAPAACAAVQTDFGPHIAENNLAFRIPTPTFGAGLIEMIPDAAILANKLANSAAKASFGISGRENRTPNDGSIARFGWKAQNKSLLVFAGEAYNVEQGVTNEMFMNAREAPADCEGLAHPEDHSNYTTSVPGDVEQFAMFMRLLAPPTPVTSYGSVTGNSVQRGRELFTQVGCAYCHTETLTTGRSTIASLSRQPVRLYSDLLVHHMGAQLADDISQGNASGDEFRTAPLWGLGQRIFLLHDGRAEDLLVAIDAHSSPASHDYPASEANTSIESFHRLKISEKQDLLNFLRSL